MAHQPKGPPQKMSAQEYARLVNQGALHVTDRYGHAIGKDSLVEYRSTLAGMAEPFWQVTDVRPVMDPRLPGHIKLELKSTTYLTLPIGVRHQALFLIGSVQRDETGKEVGNSAESGAVAAKSTEAGEGEGAGDDHGEKPEHGPADSEQGSAPGGDHGTGPRGVDGAAPGEGQAPDS